MILPIAVVVTTNTIALAARDFGVVITLEALESRLALPVVITICGTCLQGPNRVIVVPPRQLDLDWDLICAAEVGYAIITIAAYIPTLVGDGDLRRTYTRGEGDGVFLLVARPDTHILELEDAGARPWKPAEEEYDRDDDDHGKRGPGGGHGGAVWGGGDGVERGAEGYPEGGR